MSDLHEQLSAYLDGELDATARGEVETALALDPELRAELNALKRLSNQLGVDERDRQVVPVVQAALRRRTRRGWPRRLWLPALPIGAALALVLLLGVPRLAAPDVVTGEDLLDAYVEAVDVFEW